MTTTSSACLQLKLTKSQVSVDQPPGRRLACLDNLTTLTLRPSAVYLATYQHPVQVSSSHCHQELYDSRVYAVDIKQIPSNTWCSSRVDDFILTTRSRGYHIRQHLVAEQSLLLGTWAAPKWNAVGIKRFLFFFFFFVTTAHKARFACGVFSARKVMYIFTKPSARDGCDTRSIHEIIYKRLVLLPRPFV